MTSDIAAYSFPTPAVLPALSPDTNTERLPGIYGQKLVEIIQHLSANIDQEPVFINDLSFNLSEATEKHSVGLLATQFQLNKVGDPTEFFRIAFDYLSPDGYLVFPVEIIRQRKARLLRKLPWGVGHASYVGDYLLHRLASRLGPTRKLYKQIFTSTRVISKAEVLGRLYHAGFRVHELASDGNRYVVVAQKVVEEPSSQPSSSEGLIFKMVRVGKNGKPFNVYKFRTMHPYSEYLQEYLIQTSGLDSGGKFKDDFRISTLGSFARKYWIDELPMLVNLVKGDIKLVGVRPISKHYFSLYPEELQRERIASRPGLLPPYYADMPKSFDDIVQSELRYLRAYAQNPFMTDLRYLLKIAYNIFWKRARSK